MKHFLRNAVIAVALLLAGFMAAVAWLRPHLPFLNLYTDGTGDRSGTSTVRYAVWDGPQSIGAPTNSSDTESRPTLSYSGEWLFYEVGEVGANADIWMAPIVDGLAQQGKPAAALNSPADDLSPCCDDGRFVYFASNRPGGRGGFDLYRAPIETTGVGEAEPVPGDVNSAANELDPAVRPGQLALFFASDRGARRVSDYNLYRAAPAAGGFQGAEPVSVLNSSADDREPSFSPDGMIVFFASNRSGGCGAFDLWRSLEDQGAFLRPENVTALNSPADDRAPCPAAEGFALLFASNRQDSLGSLDIYRASTRELFVKPLRAFGLSDWTYVALLILAALLAFLARRFEALDLLAKCLLLSLLAHLLAVFWFRRVEVTTAVMETPPPPASFKVRLAPSDGGVTDGRGGRGRDDSYRGREALALERAFARAAADVSMESAAPASLAGTFGSPAERPVELALGRSGDPTAALAPASAPGGDAASPALTVSEDRPRAQGGAPALAVEAATLSAGQGGAPAMPSRPAGVADRQLAAAGAGTGGTPSVGAMSGGASRSLPDARMSDSHESLGPGRGAPASPTLGAAAEGDQPALLAGESPDLAITPSPMTGSSVAGTGGALTGPGSGHGELTRVVSGSGKSQSERTPATGIASRTEAAMPAPSAGSRGERGSASGRERQAGSPVAVAVPAPAEDRPQLTGSGGGGGDSSSVPGTGVLAPSALAAASTPVELPRRASAGGGGAGAGGAGADGFTVGTPAGASFAQRAVGSGSGEPAPPTRAEVQVSAPSFAPEPGPPTLGRIQEERSPAVAAAATGGAGTAGDSLAPRATLAPSRPDVGMPARARTELADVTPQPAPMTNATPRASPELPPAQPLARDLGVYSRRFGSEKEVAIKTHGGSEQTEHAVAQGLKYLASIQARDGHWGSEQDNDEKYGQVMIGKTALCLLSFLGAGHTPSSATDYADAARRAVRFLLSVQEDRSGHFGYTSAYSHGIATYALAECYAMTRAAELREPLERAVDHILAEQHQNRKDAKDHGGWGYFYPDGRVFDRWPRASITAWQVMALKSARLGGIDIPQEVFDDARSFLARCYDERLGAFRYNHDPSRLRSSYATLPGSTPAALFALSLIGDQNVDRRSIEGGFEFVRERRPNGYSYQGDDAFVHQAAGNLYFWYYGTLATFVKGGEDWQQWNTSMKATLLPAQQKDGSWRPICIYARYAGDDDKDRSYTTSMCVLMLEVYYRYFTPLLKAAGSG